MLLDQQRRIVVLRVGGVTGESHSGRWMPISDRNATACQRMARSPRRIVWHACADKCSRTSVKSSKNNGLMDGKAQRQAHYDQCLLDLPLTLLGLTCNLLCTCIGWAVKMILRRDTDRHGWHSQLSSIGNGSYPAWVAPRILRWLQNRIRERSERKIICCTPLFQMWEYRKANISRGLLNILKFSVWTISH